MERCSMHGHRLTRRQVIRIVGLGGSGVALGGLLAACGPSAPPVPAEKAAPKAEEKPVQAAPVKAAAKGGAVQMWFDLPGSQQEHVKKVNEKFTAESGIEVRTTVVTIAEMPTKLATAVAGGSPPDVAYLGGPSLIGNLMQNNKVESLTTYQKDLKDLDWLEPIKKVVVRGDDIFALPINSGVLGLYYNADLYRASGLDPEKPPTSWDDLLKNAKAIAKPDEQVWGHYVGTKPIPWSADQVWIAYLWQAGGEYMSPDEKQVAFNSEAGVEALKFYVDLVQEHKVTPQKAIDNVVSGTDFETGKIGHMQLYPIWVLRAEAMSFKVGTAAMPKHKAAGAPIGFGTMPIFTDSKNKDGAWTYLSWLMQPENNVFWCSGLGNLLPRSSTREAPSWKEHVAKHPLVQPFVDAQPQAKLGYFGKGSQEIATQVAQAIEAAVFGRKGPKQALDDAAKASNDILAR
jgi:ABC-type glycerol-3-phosphate transport system substrate-binding protein